MQQIHPVRVSQSQYSTGLQHAGIPQQIRPLNVFQSGIPPHQVGVSYPQFPGHNVVINQQRPSNVNVVQSLGRGHIQRLN